MTTATLHSSSSNTEATRSGLLAEIARIRALLEAYVATAPPQTIPPVTGSGPIDAVCRAFGLSAFERDVVILAAAIELDGDIAKLVADLHDGSDPRATFALALSALPGAHWDALSPSSPLRHWRLIDLGQGATLATRPINIDESILHTLTGLAGESALQGFLRDRSEQVPLTASQTLLADELVAAIGALDRRVLVRLDGDDGDARVGVAQRVAAGLGRTTVSLRDETLPEPGQDLGRIARLVDREALLHDRLPVLGTDLLVDMLDAPVVITTCGGSALPDRALLSRSVDLPGTVEQAMLWRGALAGAAEPAGVAEAIEEIGEHYRLSAAAIAGVGSEWAATLGGSDDAADRLRGLTRERARVSLGGLADRIDPQASWDDLVLPEGQLLLLRELVRQVRHRSRVYQDWGFAEKSNRGMGVTALFAGESGTGKTMAAEVVADDLRLDLYRIDLSAVVNKYIGETEKNLGRLFDAAEAGGAVLLFDEADALFGKRGEVRDSHDRYANLETAYLLQRMESYRGLAILTTNLRSNVDRAFLRRLRIVVQFPFPDESLRRQIWQGAFPPRTPLEDIDPAALARLQVPGGSIRAIALGAAFAAADAGTAVCPEHILYAARVEYAKAERSLTATETALIGGGR